MAIAESTWQEILKETDRFLYAARSGKAYNGDMPGRIMTQNAKNDSANQLIAAAYLATAAWILKDQTLLAKAQKKKESAVYLKDLSRYNQGGTPLSDASIDIQRVVGSDSAKVGLVRNVLAGLKNAAYDPDLVSYAPSPASAPTPAPTSVSDSPPVTAVRAYSQFDKLAAWAFQKAGIETGARDYYASLAKSLPGSWTGKSIPARFKSLADALKNAPKTYSQIVMVAKEYWQNVEKGKLTPSRPSTMAPPPALPSGATYSPPASSAPGPVGTAVGSWTTALSTWWGGLPVWVTSYGPPVLAGLTLTIVGLSLMGRSQSAPAPRPQMVVRPLPMPILEQS